VPGTIVNPKSIDAVSEALEGSAADPEALKKLDCHLRQRFLRFVQDRSDSAADLREALLLACHWAEREQRDPWRTLWTYLLELLRDAETVPALADDLRALAGPEGRAAELLALLAKQATPMRPSAVAERLRMSQQQVSNLASRLESAGLLVRRRAEGRATWLFPTARGSKLSALLPAGNERQVEQPSTRVEGAREIRFWDRRALAEPVELAS